MLANNYFPSWALTFNGVDVPIYMLDVRYERGRPNPARVSLTAAYDPIELGHAVNRKALIDFAKTGAPPVVLQPGEKHAPAVEMTNVVKLDVAENSPLAWALRNREAEFGGADAIFETGKAMVAEREFAERCVPRMQEQKPWVDPVPPCGCAMCNWNEAQIELLAHAGKKFMESVRVVNWPRPESLNDFATECHHENATWWHDPATGEKLDRDLGEMLMLVVSEIAECMEGERKDLMDDHLPHRKMAEVELADAVLRLVDIAGSRGCDLDNTTASKEDIADFASKNKGAQLLRIAKNVCAAQHRAYGGFSQQLAWAIKLIEMYAEKHGYDLWGAVAEKREYNKHRADHKPKARLAANGKKF